MGRFSLKQVSGFLCTGLLPALLLISCERDELSRSDLDLDIRIVAPDPYQVVTTDTLRVRIDLFPNDSLRFDDLTIDGFRPIFSNGRYEILLNLADRGRRISIPILVSVDGQLRFKDSLRLVKFNWQPPVPAGSMAHPRANHASLLLTPTQILTTGGVPGYYDRALTSTEIFSLTTGTSDSLPSWNLVHGRAGHAMVSADPVSFMVLGGMTRYHPGPGTDRQLPTELIYQSIHTVTDTSGLTADFAWYQSGNDLLTHGGWGSDFAGRFTFDSHSVNRTRWNRTGYQLSLHSLTPLSATPDFWFLASGDFSWSYPLMYSFYLDVSEGTLFPADLYLRTIRADHTATSLPGNFILIAGGLQFPGEGERLVDELELLDMNRGRSYRLPGKMVTARAGHTAVAAGPSIYFLGGQDASRQVLSSIEKIVLE